jgi:hypothetical protein
METQKPKKTCLLCRQQTNGSVGASGIKWSNVCQTCKDIEDNIAKQQIKSLVYLYKQVQTHYENK